jgi:hypothetical protein
MALSWGNLLKDQENNIILIGWVFLAFRRNNFENGSLNHGIDQNQPGLVKVVRQWSMPIWETIKQECVLEMIKQEGVLETTNSRFSFFIIYQ